MPRYEDVLIRKEMTDKGQTTYVFEPRKITFMDDLLDDSKTFALWGFRLITLAVVFGYIYDYLL